MVKYVYDAWGNCLETVLDIHATDIANLNPFRYRGYYYDVETKLYFLKTRYYDPEIGRFLTIDDVSYLDPDSINGLNLYAYCGNNPVMRVDPNGTFSWGDFWDIVVSAVAYAAGVATAIVVAVSLAAFVSPLVAIPAGFLAGAAVMGTINNTVNAIYYHFSNGLSDPARSDVSFIKPIYTNRWERLDYVKEQSKIYRENHSSSYAGIEYDSFSRLYYSEYNLHMYGWCPNGHLKRIFPSFRKLLRTVIKLMQILWILILVLRFLFLPY